MIESGLIKQGFVKKGLIESLQSWAQRYFRRNEGSTDGYETNARLIPDPLTHFDVEFELLGAVDPDGTFLAQSISAGSGSREFQLFQNGSALIVVLGGYSNGTTTTLTTGVWRVKLDGVNIEIFKDGVSVETIAAVVGAATEPSATFTMCARHDGDNSSYGFHYAGVMADVKIRNSYGVITHDYPINDNTSTIRDLANGQDGTIINGNADDWGLFDRQANGDWLGQELSTVSITQLLGDDFNPEFAIVSDSLVDSRRYRVNARFTSYTGNNSCGWSSGSTAGVIGIPESAPFRATNAIIGENVGGDFDYINTGGVRLFGRSDAICSFDNISVKEVLKNA